MLGNKTQAQDEENDDSDEEGGDAKEVIVEDLSTNGTFVSSLRRGEACSNMSGQINGQKIGKGRSMLLCQGNELSLGHPGTASQPEDDYRKPVRSYRYTND